MSPPKTMRWWIRHVSACLVHALVFFSLATGAYAQSRPTDVNTPVDPWVNGAPYKTDGTANVLGDGSNERGGPMPVLSIQLPDIPTNSTLRTAWTIPGGGSSEPCGTISDECKFRTIANVSHMSYDDPERNFCQFGQSHLHTFFGNTTVNACSTYASLRQRCNDLAAAGKMGSTAAGNPLNCTAYWHPTFMKLNPFGDGKNYAVIPYYYVIYYLTSPGSDTIYKSRLPRGARYVAGVNMDDYDNCGVRNEVNKANGGPGTGCPAPPSTGRYRMILESGSSDIGDGTARNGFGGYSCYNGDGTNGGTLVMTKDGKVNSPYLKSPTGEDPWDGACTSGSIAAGVHAPPCYNGKDLWVPGSYGHFRQKILDTLTGKQVCPNGSWEVPTLLLTVWIRHNGFSDYGNIRLSSDDMAATAAGHPVPNGGSFHVDWFGAWDDAVFVSWMEQCQGVNGVTPSICDSSRFSVSPATAMLVQASPEYDKYNTTTAAGMRLVPANKGVGPATMAATPKP